MMLKAPLKASAQLLHGNIVCIAVLLQSDIDKPHRFTAICNAEYLSYRLC
jgi:hypothetical protein